MRLSVLAATAVLSLAAVGLVACEQPAAPAEPAPADPAEPAPPPSPPKAEINGVDLTQDLRAIGTEPFWAVEIGKAGLKTSGVDKPERTAPNGGPVMEQGRATWTSTTADGLALRVVLTTGPCSDGMSDRTYPLNAEVQLGDEALKGCAATVEALNKRPETGDVR